MSWYERLRWPTGPVCLGSGQCDVCFSWIMFCWQTCASFGGPQSSSRGSLVPDIWQEICRKQWWKTISDEKLTRRAGICQLYADDTQLYISTPNHPNEAVDVMTRCLEAVRVWMGTNRLRLNPSKTEWLWIPASRHSQLIPSLTVGGELLAPRELVRNLGVLLDAQLSLEDHLTAIARGAFYQVRLIRQLPPFLDRDSLCTVTHALVTSRLDYCNALYMGLPLKSTRRLQLVQNAAARGIEGVSRSSHVTHLLRRLHWLPVVFQAC
ncbi:uncharacterized protein LOC131193674 [Ahaetulla prasina]|uniref:uncharacterized protein LOC131193674 n=1 Tax=Ahaetulla prasina TaxID=499056 RepID=UPI00264A04B5|nr:uncharacterized protein LOC131193674 [Ahaetulla prasina]